jgi:hypothetical protein
MKLSHPLHGTTPTSQQSCIETLGRKPSPVCPHASLFYISGHSRAHQAAAIDRHLGELTRGDWNLMEIDERFPLKTSGAYLPECIRGNTRVDADET